MRSESGDLLFRLHDVQNGTSRKKAQIPDLTSAQRGIWFAQQLNPTNPTYNIAEYLEIHGPLEPMLFERALRQVVAEAETLHFTFADDGQGPQQKLSPQDEWRLPIIDCVAEADPQAAAEAWMRADLARPLDLSQGPLFSFALFRAAPDWFLFYHRYHHIISDGAARALIVQRLAEIYSALVTGQPSGPSWFGGLCELAAADAEYHNSAAFQQDRCYWMERFGDVPTPASLSGAPATTAATVRAPHPMPPRSATAAHPQHSLRASGGTLPDRRLFVRRSSSLRGRQTTVRGRSGRGVPRTDRHCRPRAREQAEQEAANRRGVPRRPVSHRA
jgi:hypothetical protein